jgi:hypothetical protein
VAGSRVPLVLLLLTAAGVSRPAHAFVRSQTAGGVPFAWKKSCAWMTAFPTDLPLMTRDEVSNAFAASAAAWSKQDPANGACSFLDLKFLVAAAGATQPPAKNDGTNGVGLRRDTWCPQSPNCYDPAALALTSVFARTSTGEIIDADIEVNGVNFSWADVTRTAPTGTEQDLQNAVTHEMGHVIGLDHTCYFGSGPRPNDQNGVPIPDCAAASQAVMDTTMFPSANSLDTNKRTLAADDRMGLCASYPLAMDPMSCPAPTSPDAGADAGPTGPDAGFDARARDAGSTMPSNKGCSCETSGRGGRTSGALLAGVALLILRRPPRRLRRPGRS